MSSSYLPSSARTNILFLVHLSQMTSSVPVFVELALPREEREAYLARVWLAATNFNLSLEFKPDFFQAHAHRGGR